LGERVGDRQVCGTVGLSETNTQLGLAAYQLMDYSFFATATDSLSEFAFIGFGATDTPDYAFYLTDVSVTAVASSPEPSGLILCGAGLAFIIAVLWHRRGSHGDRRAPAH
jgi:hypothetical protein